MRQGQAVGRAMTVRSPTARTDRSC
jgi:hypothetical protein